MLPVLHVGPLALPMRELLFVMSLWPMMELMTRLAYRRGGQLNAAAYASNFGDFGLLVIGVSLLAARLVYAANYWSSYWRQPFDLLSLSIQSMAWAEGVLIGLLVGLLYLHRQQIPLRNTLDILAPIAALLWAVVGLGTFFSGDAYGQVTTMPWGIFLWQEYRHPVQLFQTLAGGIIAALLIWRLPHAPYPSWIGLVGIALLGLARLFIEGLRGAPTLTTGGLRVVQLWALVISLLALWALYRAQQAAEAIKIKDEELRRL